jgi:hypothetical protein
MRKDEDRMDIGTIAAIALLIAALLLIAAVIVILIGKYRADEAAAFEKHTQARLDYDRALIGAAKVLTVGRMAFLTTGVSGDMIQYRQFPVDGDGTPILTDVIDGAKVNAHNIASSLVHDSIIKRGINGTQLMTAEEWEQLGNSRLKHGVALEYLKGLNTIRIKQGGTEQGTFVKEGNLQGLMLDLSVAALPLAMGQGVSKA